MRRMDGSTAAFTRSNAAVSDLGISVRDAVLEYPLGPLARGSMKSQLFSLFGSKRPEAEVEFIRALNGVSFELHNGDRLGVIGQNGSGKSTLLRALAGIYPLASGQIEVRGRVQGMFDIGLGFEPEATGRENILYRGLVMGLSPAEVREREREIIDFAAIGPFIDLPIRTYSTGMAVRLAFAISTYLQGEILLLDEMLGAGDASFQKKARDRMNSLLEAAKIMVLVSHDMGTIRSICPRTIWLRGGRIVADGPSEVVIDSYLQAMTPAEMGT